MNQNMLKIPCIYYRGGTSKGPCFLKQDLPENIEERDALLLSIMGSPDKRQIDGIGGGDSLSSKVVIINKSERHGVDIDYLLCQVHITDPIVETTLNCGNMLSVVAPFAIERGLVHAVHPETTVRIYNENTGVIMESTVQTPNGILTYSGNCKIDGVPGTAAPIKLTFLNAVGAKTGKLLPTGHRTDVIDNVPVTCIDVAVPMVIAQANHLGKTGYESKDALNADHNFLKRLEDLRKKAAILMGLGDASKSINPKICIVSPPREGGTITSRYFTPFECHDAHAVSGGLCLAAATLIPGSTANIVAQLRATESNEHHIVIEHASGQIETDITIQNIDNDIDIPKASFIRTARPLFEGNVYAMPTYERSSSPRPGQ